MKKVVLDTNILLVSISSKSKLHWIFNSLLEGEYTLCVTTDILAEYAEIVELRMGALASQNALTIIENLPNIEFVTAYYRFGLLQDEDDNKFIDCAIANNAHFVVTHDRDFDVLRNINFPKITVVNTEQFKTLLYL